MADAMELGRRDFTAGKTLTQNRFACGKEHRLWAHGWYEARAKWLEKMGGREL